MNQLQPVAPQQRASFVGFLQLVFAAIVLGVFIVVGLAAVNAMQSDSEQSIAAAIGAAIGEAEGAHAESQMMQEADFKHRLALADAEIKRISDYYAAFYQSVGIASQRASEWEGALIQRQAQTVSNNNVVETFGANVLSIGCIGAALDPSNRDARDMCEAANTLGGSMVEDYTVLPEHRPRYVEDVLNDFPRPGALISDEYLRLRAEFGGAYRHAE